ncbi:putative transporter small subunit [Acidovorax sp. Be4]|jgi:hypothetical protein|uniref:Transporter small subunit n=1 Tax=Acidovorax bellezanensis TaxID=2976702 RepID=A0ABT2PUE7_9BURK|nr:putative transporter small subunit [Acidovorax sp. Be4]MCT9812768.1 putative transporter small subunit [Acidovorax sp. Be4]
MNTSLLTLYVLVWPALAAIVLLVLSGGVWHDMRAAKARGESLV